MLLCILCVAISWQNAHTLEASAYLGSQCFSRSSKVNWEIALHAVFRFLRYFFVNLIFYRKLGEIDLVLVNLAKEKMFSI